MKIFIQEDGGSYGRASGYAYWSAYRENGRKIDFGASAFSEKSMRAIVKRWYPEATIIVEKSRIGRE